MHRSSLLSTPDSHKDPLRVPTKESELLTVTPFQCINKRRADKATNCTPSLSAPTKEASGPTSLFQHFQSRGLTREIPFRPTLLTVGNLAPLVQMCPFAQKG